jgi:hypothetical protein
MHEIAPVLPITQCLFDVRIGELGTSTIAEAIHGPQRE